jgi:hypothetical protein
LVRSSWKHRLLLNKKDVIVIAVISSHDYPLAEKDANWDVSAAEKSIRTWAGGSDSKKIDWGKYRSCFLWYDATKPEEFGSYKFCYCTAASGGPHVVFRALSATMGALHGGRSGTSIPDSEKKGVYNQAAKQYKRFDEEPEPYDK